MPYKPIIVSMKKHLNWLLSLIIIAANFQTVNAQETNNSLTQNASQRMISSEKKLTIGGYGQIDYNQPFGNDQMQNGKLDVHRLVLLFGYNFNKKLSFVTEIEIEHVKEVYVEQAFLNYAVNTYFNVRGGLMLIPMGIINEYHEPTTFNGVERPLIDKYIAPTTWREIGLGFTGTIPEVSMRYQAYMVNGFSSYNGSANLSGNNGLRKGRQKGAESFISTPNIAARVEFYGLLGLNLGLSGYFGKTQSTLYNGLNKDDKIGIAVADSSVVGISMIGFDARYERKGIQLRGQFYYNMFSNTNQYNAYTADGNAPNDLGSAQYGYYVEAAYNVFQSIEKIKTTLTPFVRYSNYDTHYNVVDGITKNDAYQVDIITTGLGYKLVPGVAIKADVQFIKSKADSKSSNTFNAGIGVWF